MARSRSTTAGTSTRRRTPSRLCAPRWKLNRRFLPQVREVAGKLVGCREEFVSLMQLFRLVPARLRTGFAEPRPEEAVLTSGLRQATRVCGTRRPARDF